MKNRLSVVYARVACCLVVLSLVAPVGAVGPAAPEVAPTITFEESIPGPQVVRSQYCNNPATNKGVEFLDVGGHIFEPVVSTASPSHALVNIFPGEEFKMDRFTKISFTTVQSDVSVKVGLDRDYGFDVTARLMAFTAAAPTPASLVAFDEVALGKGPAPITSLLSVSRAQGDIRSVSVDFFGPGVAEYAYEVIDDLTYSAIGPPCVEDLSPPSVLITEPPVDGWGAHTPTTEIAFTAWDNETGIARVRISYLGDQGGEIDGFFYCGGPHTTPCPSAGSTVYGDLLANLPVDTQIIQVEVYDFAGHGRYAERSIDLALPSATRNLWLQGLEITQATQNWVPEQTQTRRGGDIPASWVYPGPPTAVPLVAGHTTVARVYASVEGTGPGIPLVGATAVLRCYTDYEYLVPCPGPANLTSSEAVSVWPETTLDTKRGQADLSWNFVLPGLWTWLWAVQPPDLASRIYLEAEVVAPPALPECAGCADAANRMRVAGVEFTATEPFWPRVKVLGYNWTVQGQTFNLDPNDVQTSLDYIRKIYPIEEATVPTSIWVGTYDDGLNLGPTDPGDDRERCDALLDFAKGGYSSLGKYKRLALIAGEFPCGGVGSLSGGNAFANASSETTGAHELGHACGVRHCGTPGHGNECGESSWCDDDWPWPHGTLGYHGFDTVTMQAIVPGTTESDRHDVMSYGGGGRWISPRNWTRLFNVFASASVPIPGADVEGPAAAGDYLWVRGRLETGTGWILPPAYELELPAGSNDEVGEGEYRIELLDASGHVLSERRFSLEPGHIDGFEPEEAVAEVPSFNEVLPLPAGVATIALRHEADTLASRARSAQWPSVTVLSPTAAGFQGQPDNPYVFWSGDDPDEEPVYYLIQYTREAEAGAGAEWQTLGIDVEGEALPVSLEGLGGSDQAMVRILATDGFNTTPAASPTFAVSDKPPGAQILSPETETSLDEGERLVLRGTAFDREDGLLEGEALSWYDYGAALLGTGRRLDVSTLAPGDHAIVLVAEDSSGQMDMEVVSVTVVERPNTQPVADAGPDRSTGVGSPVTLFGAWSSDADGDPLTYHWEVSDQPPGSAAVLDDPTAVLPSFSADQTGSYEVTLVVNDGQVSSLPDRVSVIVGAAGARIYLEAPESRVTISDTVSVELRIDAIEDLYAAQVELSFDPSLLEVVDANGGVPGIQVEEGDFPVPDVVLNNAADNAAGRIYYTVSLQGSKPGVNGSGLLARITFHGLQEGLSRLVLEQVVLSDPLSQEIEVRVEDGVVWVEEPLAAAVAGRAILERRPSDAGVEATIGGRSTTTGESGEFVLLGAPAGTQTVTLRRESYLATWREVALAEGQTLSLPDVTLLGGDVNGDDRIGQIDGGEIGLAWNTTPVSPEWSGAADITDDQEINVLDAVAVQYNWNQVAPGPWAGAMVADAGASAGYEGLLVPEATTRVAISQTLATLAGVGDGVELQIRVEDVEHLYGGHVIVEFDPAVLRVRDADPRPSAPGVQVRPGEFLDLVNRFELVNRADNGAGTIEYAVTQLNPATARSGSGVLATIVFEGRRPGSSPVHISLVELTDDTRPTPQLIPASTQDGQVTVGAQWSLYLPLSLKGH